MPLKKGRYAPELSFTTSPIKHLAGVATDLCWLERNEKGALEIAGLVCASGQEGETLAAIQTATGSDLPVREDVERIPLPEQSEIALLRSFDPARALLG